MAIGSLNMAGIVVNHLTRGMNQERLISKMAWTRNLSNNSKKPTNACCYEPMNMDVKSSGETYCLKCRTNFNVDHFNAVLEGTAKR